MDWLHFYGMWLGVTLVLAALSHDKIIQRASWLLGVGWVFSRLAEGAMGFANAPFIVPSFDALLAVGIGVIGYRSQSLLCFIVVLLYLAEESFAIVGLTTQRQGDAWYYTLNGGAFALKLMAVSGGSVVALAHRWRRGGVGFVPGRASGRAGLVR